MHWSETLQEFKAVIKLTKTSVGCARKALKLNKNIYLLVNKASLFRI